MAKEVLCCKSMGFPALFQGTMYNTCIVDYLCYTPHQMCYTCLHQQYNNLPLIGTQRKRSHCISSPHPCTICWPYAPKRMQSTISNKEREEGISQLDSHVVHEEHSIRYTNHNALHIQRERENETSWQNNMQQRSKGSQDGRN